MATPFPLLSDFVADVVGNTDDSFWWQRLRCQLVILSPPPSVVGDVAVKEQILFPPPELPSMSLPSAGNFPSFCSDCR